MLGLEKQLRARLRTCLLTLVIILKHQLVLAQLHLECFLGSLLLFQFLFVLSLNVFLRENFYNLLVTIGSASGHDDMFGEEAPDALALPLKFVLHFLVRQLLVLAFMLLDHALVINQITVLEMALDERFEILTVSIVLALCELPCLFS